MHVYFAGIGGSAIGPLAMIAKQAGWQVSGSDVRDSSYIKYLRERGLSDIHIGQDGSQIATVHAKRPIDWFVYSSALPLTDPSHPELKFCQQNGIKTSKRDEFLSDLIKEKSLKLIAVTGTHGKTTTTAMAIWLFKQMDLPVSYSVGSKLSFGEMGQFDPDSQYFVYEADEYDRNFLSFYPEIALISGLDWDHPDIYPSRESYYSAFLEFIGQATQTVLWRDDAEKLGLSAADNLKILDEKDSQIDVAVKLAGHVNRLDAWLTAYGLQALFNQPAEELIKHLNEFPGASRRFETIAPNLYSDYAHTPPKIRGALQLAHETAGDNVVVVYEGIHNLRQHFMKDEFKNLFDSVKKVYIVPTYLGREDGDLEILTPAKLLDLLSNSARPKAEPAKLDDDLKQTIQNHLAGGDLVIGFSAGSAGGLDEWLRQEFQ
ncbi:MAG TPA: Mur ligase domain-containing protein [Candidatus Saccharimonadales bacterium]|nr:Mur ligase domain-containing protein [Candidatus Saccharimonadales bacterium]